MPKGPAPKPLPLLSHPFTPLEADRADVPRSRLRARDLERRVYGVRAATGAYDDLPERCRLFARRLPPEVFFSHTTAALLMGVPLPLHLERRLEVHASVPAPQRAPHAHGLRGHSRAVSPGDVRDVHGIRLSSPERAWCELASVLDVPQLVAAGDHLIHHNAPWTSTDALARRIAIGDRIARSAKLPAALALLDDRAESAQESLLRVLLYSRGLTGARVNRVVVRSTAGPGIRRDFTFAAERVAVEYQGDYHRTMKQWRADMTRRGRLEALGWQVMEVNADDLHDPGELTTRIRTVLARQRQLFARDC